MEFLPLVLLALLFWFFILRPQRRRSRQQAELWSGLEPGTEVVTMGGVYGRITDVDDETVQLEVAPGTVLRVDRRAIARRDSVCDLDAGAPAAVAADPDGVAPVAACVSTVAACAYPVAAAAPSGVAPAMLDRLVVRARVRGCLPPDPSTPLLRGRRRGA